MPNSTHRRYEYGDGPGYWLNPFTRYFRCYTKQELSELQGVKDLQNHVAVATPVINFKYNKLIEKNTTRKDNDTFRDGWIVRYPTNFTLYFTDKEFRTSFRKVKMRKEFYSTIPQSQFTLTVAGNAPSTKGAHK